jgi:hypothetical protein
MLIGHPSFIVGIFDRIAGYFLYAISVCKIIYRYKYVSQCKFEGRQNRWHIVQDVARKMRMMLNFVINAARR